MVGEEASDNLSHADGGAMDRVACARDRLHPAVSGPGASAKCMHACFVSAPDCRKTLPCPACGRLDLCVHPPCAAIHRDIDSLNATVAPSPAPDFNHGSSLERFLRTWCHYDGLGCDGPDWHRRTRWHAGLIANGIVIPAGGEWPSGPPLCQLDAGQPLDAVGGVEAGNHQPDGKAILGPQRLAIHFERDQHVCAHALDWQVLYIRFRRARRRRPRSRRRLTIRSAPRWKECIRQADRQAGRHPIRRCKSAALASPAAAGFPRIGARSQPRSCAAAAGR